MSRELLASQKNNSGILLDPRTKLAVLITIAVFILGGSYEGIMQYYISTKHWSSCSGNDECKSSLNYRMCLCDTNLKFGEHGPLWIWSLDLCIEKQQCL